MSGKTYYLFEDWDRFFLPAFATVVFCPELTSIEKFPCVSFLIITIETVSLCPAAADEAWRCQQSTRSFSPVPWSQCSRPQGKLGALWKVSLIPSRPTPYFPALYGVVPGDNRPLQGWNSETRKEESPHREGKSHTVCPSSGGGITAMQVLSLLVTLAQTVQHLWEPARPRDQLKHANLLHVTAVWQTFLQFNYKLQCRSRKRKNKLQTI